MTAEHQPFDTFNCPRCAAPLPPFEEDVCCSYCGTRLRLRRSPGPAPSPGPAQPRPAGLDDLPTAPLTYVDPRTGLDAFSLQIPVGWQFDGGVAWQNVAATPSVLQFRLYNPAGPEQLEVFPTRNYGFSSDPMIQMRVPLGGPFYQSEFRPPMPAALYLRQVLLPAHRGSLPGLEIVGEMPDDELRRIGQENAQKQSQSARSPVNYDTARLAVRYPFNGGLVREEFAIVLLYLAVSAGWSQSLFWWTEIPSAVRAPADQFDLWKPRFDALGKTFHWDARFLEARKQANQQMTQGIIHQQNQAAQAAIRIGKQLSQTGDIQWQGYLNRTTEADQQWQSRQNQQASQDRVHEQYVQAVRGTETYQDPLSGQALELPQGYQQGWTNALGEIVLSDDPLYDPNLGSTTTWTALRPTQRSAG